MRRAAVTQADARQPYLPRNARAVLVPGETFNHGGIVGPAIVVLDITQAYRKRLAARLGRR
jgi:hypothetical protein